MTGKRSDQLMRLFILGLTISLLLFCVAGCGGQKAGGPGGGGREVASYAVADPTGDWGFPSPFAHYSRGPGYIRMSFIFDTLIWKNDKDYLPALADSWEYLKEENAYLFNLNKNASWHDGKNFTAGDVAFTFAYMKDHNYQWVDLGVLKKVEVLDDHKIKLYLERQYAPFLDNIAGTVPILPEHIWKEVQDPLQFQQKEALIGTGPYKLADYNKAQGTYLYEANENYYRGKPRVKQLKFVKMSGEMAPAALRQKQANASQVPPELAKDLEKEGMTLLVGSHDWVAKLMINHQKAPLDNKAFRQALAYAVDRKAMVATTLRGHGMPGSPGLLPPDSPWYNSRMEGRYAHDPGRAAEILNDLGYVKKDKYFEKDGRVLELELLVSGGGIGTPGAPREREGEMIKDQLERLGIKINLRSLEAKTLDNLVGEWKFDLALSGHGGMGSDPEILNKVILGKGFNSARYQQNQELNTLLKQQLTVLEDEKRKELLDKVQEIYAEEMPCLTLYYPTWYWAHDGQVNLFYTRGGVGSGVPIPLNKAPFVS